MSNTDRRTFLSSLSAAAAMTTLPSALTGTRLDSERSPADSYTLAAYYFGNYHVDPRNEAEHGPGWTEWRLVEQARPRFKGHAQPKVPLWGYEDESDPMSFARKIKAASSAGLTAFIFDWYWYNDGPFLQSALEKGYLGAANKSNLKFAIMWANHDWHDVHPAKLTSSPKLQYSGKVTIDTFRTLTDHVIHRYFREPSYWTIDGQPYFSIYELSTFVQGMGGVEAAASALAEFRVRTKAAGFSDLHLNAVTWGVKLLPGESDVPDLKSLLEELRVDSVTSYVWVHHVKLAEFPVTQYNTVAKAYEGYRATASEALGKPYFPNVSVGWDSSPRSCQTDMYVQKEYPYTPIIQGNTPAQFGNALRSAKKFLDHSTELKHKILTINSWNEWTEGSYLEPDEQNQFDYLDQIRRVFSQTRNA